jgi:DNA repair protein RAD16
LTKHTTSRYVDRASNLLMTTNIFQQRTTGSAKACFALKADHKWCLSGTPLQNRIGEFFSLVRFLDIRPFACYFCKQCDCSKLNWEMNEDNRCSGCNHSGMQHVSVFNQELLNPIQKFGNKGPGKEAFRKLRILTDRFMLRRVKRDHSSAMEVSLPSTIEPAQAFHLIHAPLSEPLLILFHSYLPRKSMSTGNSLVRKRTTLQAAS